MPILRAAGLLVLRTMAGGGEMEGEGEAEAEEDEERRDSVTKDLDSVLSGEDERGVGGSEDVSEDKDGILEVELWDGVGVRRRGEEFVGDDSSW